jgi:hypothetical protein
MSIYEIPPPVPCDTSVTTITHILSVTHFPPAPVDLSTVTAYPPCFDYGYDSPQVPPTPDNASAAFLPPSSPLPRPAAAIALNRMVRAMLTTSLPPTTTRSTVLLRPLPPRSRRGGGWPPNPSLPVTMRSLRLFLLPPNPSLLLALTGFCTLTSVVTSPAACNVTMAPH